MQRYPNQRQLLSQSHPSSTDLLCNSGASLIHRLLLSSTVRNKRDHT